MPEITDADRLASELEKVAADTFAAANGKHTVMLSTLGAIMLRDLPTIVSALRERGAEPVAWMYQAPHGKWFFEPRRDPLTPKQIEDGWTETPLRAGQHMKGEGQP